MSTTTAPPTTTPTVVAIRHPRVHLDEERGVLTIQSADGADVVLHAGPDDLDRLVGALADVLGRELR